MSRKRAAKPAAAEVQPGGVSEQKQDSTKRGGRPPYEPTLQDRTDVRLMKADGWSDDRIARQLRISRNTLLKNFREELSDGADSIRRIALRNLLRASNKGNTGASNSLLKRSDLEPPPPPKPEQPEAAPEEKLGKKEQAKREALTAEQGTSWHELMTDTVN